MKAVVVWAVQGRPDKASLYNEPWTITLARSWANNELPLQAEHLDYNVL